MKRGIMFFSITLTILSLSIAPISNVNLTTKINHTNEVEKLDLNDVITETIYFGVHKFPLEYKVLDQEVAEHNPNYVVGNAYYKLTKHTQFWFFVTMKAKLGSTLFMGQKSLVFENKAEWRKNIN